MMTVIGVVRKNEDRVAQYLLIIFTNRILSCSLTFIV